MARTSSGLSRKTKSGCLVTPRSKHPRSLLFCLPPSTGLEYAARSEPTAFVSSARLPAAPCESLSGQACFEEPSFAVTFAVTLSVQTLSVQTLSELVDFLSQGSSAGVQFHQPRIFFLVIGSGD